MGFKLNAESPLEHLFLSTYLLNHAGPSNLFGPP
jgi:hypothetical protein